MKARLVRLVNRVKYAAIGAAVGAAVGAVFGRSAASTGGGFGALVGATVGETVASGSTLVERVDPRESGEHLLPTSK